MKVYRSEKGQAMPGPVQPVLPENFAPITHTELRWLGGGGILLNCRGTTIMIDPVLEGFDMPLLFEPPITAPQVPRLDSVLITHIDNDHFSVPTCQRLAGVCKAYHATQYVAEVMGENGLPGTGHEIGEKFAVGPVSVTLTPAWHNWQSESPDHQYREWKREDCCGYWLDTPDGTIWLPGDSRLLPEHLELPAPDVILFDFSDNDWHIGLEGAVKLANTYPHAQLLCIHWGTVDAPDFTPFNANPESLLNRVENPARVLVANPGQALILEKSKCHLESASE